jgi:hypothetical protein
MAIILRRGSETVPAAANIDLWNRTAEEIVDWMIYTDRDKAAKVRWALGERLGLSDQRQKQQGYTPTEDQAHWNEAEPRYNLPIIDKAAGWDTSHGKLAWLDGLSFEDKFREAPALLSNFDDWLDQVQGITPAWKKHVAPS